MYLVLNENDVNRALLECADLPVDGRLRVSFQDAVEEARLLNFANEGRARFTVYKIKADQ